MMTAELTINFFMVLLPACAPPGIFESTLDNAGLMPKGHFPACRATTFVRSELRKGVPRESLGNLVGRWWFSSGGGAFQPAARVKITHGVERAIHATWLNESGR